MIVRHAGRDLGAGEVAPDYGSSKLQTVQALRALAAIMVAVAHASEEAKYYFALKSAIDFSPLTKGVDLFFVISGFIIFYSSGNLRGSATEKAKLFFYNRLTRVVPFYYIFTTAMVVILVLFPSGVKETSFDIGQIISSYAFIPYERYDGRIAPVLSVGWTLNFEMFFYCIFGMFVWLRSGVGAYCVIATLIILSAIGAVIPETAPAAIRTWTSSLILEFAMGIAIALLYERKGKSLSRDPIVAYALIALGAVALYGLNGHDFPRVVPRFLTAGVPATIIVGSAILLLPASVEARVPKPFVALGDSSYSLYLSHRFIQRPIQILLRKSMGAEAMTGWIYMLTAIPAAIILAHIVFKKLEVPLLAVFKRRRAQTRMRSQER